CTAYSVVSLTRRMSLAFIASPRSGVAVNIAHNRRRQHASTPKRCPAPHRAARRLTAKGSIAMTHPAPVPRSDDTGLRGALGGMSSFPLAMTVPQVWTIWAGHQAPGVSVLSWSAYSLSALLWFWYGLRRPDRNSWLRWLG